MSGYGPVRSHAAHQYGSPYCDEEEISTLWIGNAVPGTTDAELAASFTTFGTLVTCFLLQKPSPNGQLSGFIRFATRAEAESALQVVNHGHIEINGAVIVAKWADRNSKPTGSSAVDPRQLQRAALHAAPAMVAEDADELATIWVGDVEPGTADQELAEAFGTYGRLLACFLTQKLSPNGQMSGFVRYPSAQEARAALQAAEAGAVRCRGAQLTARWASRNTGITKSLLDAPWAAAPQLELAVAAGAEAGVSAATEAEAWANRAAVEEDPDEQAWASIVAAEMGEVHRQNQEWAAQTKPLAASPPSRPAAEVGEEELTTLWIGNVPVGTSDAEMQALFSPHGELQACFLLRKPSPNGQLSGFVRYPTVSDALSALQAVEDDLMVVRGHKLAVRWASRNTAITKQASPSKALELTQEELELYGGPEAHEHDGGYETGHHGEDVLPWG